MYCNGYKVAHAVGAFRHASPDANLRGSRSTAAAGRPARAGRAAVPGATTHQPRVAAARCVAERCAHRAVQDGGRAVCATARVPRAARRAPKEDDHLGTRHRRFRLAARVGARLRLHEPGGAHEEGGTQRPPRRAQVAATRVPAELRWQSVHARGAGWPPRDA